MRTDFRHLLVHLDGGVLTITFNRPEVLNAFNDTMLEELEEAVEAAAEDGSVRCVVLTGAGRGFGSGQDVRTFAKAHSSGVAAGISCNIALACDLRIASDNARFLEAFARIGLVPDGGGGYFLPRLVGLGKALEMAMLAEEVSGREAERIGLVNKCVPDKEFESSVNALAARLANGPTRAYGLMKELINTSLVSDLPTSLRQECDLQDLAAATDDHREGVAAFLEKRRPNFTGR